MGRTTDFMSVGCAAPARRRTSWQRPEGRRPVPRSPGPGRRVAWSIASDPRSRPCRPAPAPDPAAPRSRASVVVRAQDAPAAPAAPKKAEVGPKRGSQVRRQQGCSTGQGARPQHGRTAAGSCSSGIKAADGSTRSAARRGADAAAARGVQSGQQQQQQHRAAPCMRLHARADRPMLAAQPPCRSRSCAPSLTGSTRPARWCPSTRCAWLAVPFAAGSLRPAWCPARFSTHAPAGAHAAAQHAGPCSSMQPRACSHAAGSWRHRHREPPRPRLGPRLADAPNPLSNSPPHSLTPAERHQVPRGGAV